MLMSFPVHESKRGLVEEYADLIKNLGLPAEILFDAEGVTILVGSNKDNLDKLKDAWNTHDDKELGQALGIPSTAIEAFVGEIDKLDPIPEDIKNSEAMRFSPTQVLSAEHWEEELKIGQERADFLKSVSPTLYEEYKNRKST